jgi:hypothetical protein
MTISSQAAAIRYVLSLTAHFAIPGIFQANLQSPDNRTLKPLDP